MSTPSLLNIPYLYKAGTLYSQIPESGAGDFTVSRTTTVANRSTRINKDGLIEFVNDNVPRLDYPLGGAVNGCPALLVEPSATNICLRSTWEGGGSTPTGWSLGGGTGTSTPVSSLLGADSVAYSFLATSQRAFFHQTITISNATNYTFSFYVESITVGLAINEVFLFFSGASNVVYVDPDGITMLGTDVISKIGRYQVRMLSTATSTQIRIGLGVGGNRTGSFILSRPQLETGSVATSYIPTTTAAVTRNAEVISVTGAVSGSIGQTEGTIYAEVDVSNLGAAKNILQIDNGTATNRIGLFVDISPTRLTFLMSSAGVTNSLSGTVATGVIKIAASYSSGNVQVFTNGSFLVSGTIATYPIVALNAISVGSRISSGVYGVFLNDRIRAAALYTTRLTNAQLAALTTL